MLKALPETRHSPRHFSIVLLPEFSILAVSAVIETLKAANHCARREAYRWSLHSADGQPVLSSSGVALAPSGTLEDIGPRTSIVLCGGWMPVRDETEGVGRWLRRAARQATLVVGLQAAVWLMARCGLLEGCRAAIHWELVDSFRETFADVEVSARLFEIDKVYLTCAGGEATIDMLVSVIADNLGPEIAGSVADRLIHGRVRPGNEQQVSAATRYNGKNPFLVRAIEIMESNVESPLDLAEIARQIGCSRRQIERIFDRFVGSCPANFYRNMRLERGRRLLAETRMSCLEVALACGFTSQGTFCRSYQRRFGITPIREREVSQFGIAHSGSAMGRGEWNGTSPAGRGSASGHFGPVIGNPMQV